MKIPTILGLILIITALSLGLILYSFQKTQTEKIKLSSIPKDIKVVNLSDSTATITWQTNLPIEGEIELFEESKSIRRDDRDTNAPNPHMIHFVTLRNLSPNTKYSYKIKSGQLSFPTYNLEFKTNKKLEVEKPQTEKNNSIRGTILNTNLNPIDEALITLKLDGAQEIAGISGISGNFILPLNNLLTADGSNFFQFDFSVPAQVIIESSNYKSIVTLNLPLENTNLPPITIGQNINLNEYLRNVSNNAKQQNIQVDTSIYDLNKDGTLNSLDSAMVSDNINRRNFKKEADLNNDGKVDQKDLTLILKSLQ